MKNGRVVILLILFFAFLAYLLKNLINLDPDFGWHLRMGEYILKNGIPARDPFSYTMQSFPFVDHEWLSNIIIFSIYKLNPLFLNFIFAALPAAAIFLTLPKKIDKFFAGILLLSSTSLIAFSNIRVQELTWVFFALLIKVIFDEKLWKRWRFFLPILIVFWTNLHGAFAVSIFILAGFLGARIYQKKCEKQDVFVLIFSIFATFINPYGVRLWGEVFGQGLDASLRFSISEWLPAFFFYDFALLLLTALFLVLVINYWKKLAPTKLWILVIVSVLALSSVRNVPLFIIVNLFVVQDLLREFYKDTRGVSAKKRFAICAKVFLVITILTFGYKFLANATDKSMSEEYFYPHGAVIFLKENTLPAGQIFSIYNWGGYLDWKLPAKKVFVDGRMPSWRFHAPKNESNFAFSDYNKIMSGQLNYKKIFGKYNIRYVLLDRYVDDADWIEKLEKILLKNKNKKSLEQKLNSAGWKKVYSDNISVIYEDNLRTGIK